MNGYLVLAVLCAAVAICAAQEERIDILGSLGGITDRSKGPAGGVAATKGGYAGFGLAGFASAVLLITFAALLGGIILLLISGGSFVTVGLSSLTGRKKRDLNTEESSGWLDTVGSFILNALEKGYNIDHSQ